MEFDALKAAAEQARRFTHEIDGRMFHAVVPTQFAANVIAAEAKIFDRTQRRLVLESLRGWNNVTTTDLRLPPDAVPAEPLVFSRTCAELLLDERPDWEESLCDEISKRIGERRAAIKEQSGN